MNYSTMTDSELSEQWDRQRKIIESPWSVTRKSVAERRLKLIEAEMERRQRNEKAMVATTLQGVKDGLRADMTTFRHMYESADRAMSTLTDQLDDLDPAKFDD